MELVRQLNILAIICMLVAMILCSCYSIIHKLCLIAQLISSVDVPLEAGVQ